MKREAEACLYFHFKATQTLLLLLALLLTESICTQTPQGDSSVFRLPFNAHGGRKSYPLKLHLSCYRHRPSPQSLKITAHSRCVGFTLPAQARWSRQLEFQREPNQQQLWLLLKTEEFKPLALSPKAFCKFALLQEGLPDYVILCAKGTHELMSRAIISYKKHTAHSISCKSQLSFCF